MLEKRRPAGDEGAAESLNESTDLDSLLSAILGDRADDTLDKEPARSATAATLRLEVERLLMSLHPPATLEDHDKLSLETGRLALLDYPDRPYVRTIERRSEEDSNPSIEGSRSQIYSRAGTRHGRSRTFLLSMSAVPVLILLSVFGLRQFNRTAPAADPGAGTGAVPAPAVVVVTPTSPSIGGAATPAIDASGLAAAPAVPSPPKALIRVDDLPRRAVSDGSRISIRPSNLTTSRAPTVTVGERPATVAGRSAPPPATPTEAAATVPPTPVASPSPAATTATPALDAPTPQPAVTRETAPDSATVRVVNPPSPPAAGPAAAATTAAVPVSRPTQPRLVTGGAPEIPARAARGENRRHGRSDGNDRCDWPRHIGASVERPSPAAESRGGSRGDAMAIPARHVERCSRADGDQRTFRVRPASAGTKRGELNVLTTEQKTNYENIRRTALAELEALDREIAAELTTVRKRLLDLQEDKKSVKQILDGASARLGLGSSAPFKEISLADLSRLTEPSEATGSGSRITTAS